MTTFVYPASPAELPRNLTGLSAAYMAKAILAVLAILLFALLYVALVIALGYLFYLSLIFDIGATGIYPLLIKLGAIAGAGMLLFFTIKFLFKLKNPEPANRIELTRRNHPQLWAFVEQVCRETGAPMPKAIYVDPDVNAYVAYTNIWLSLFLPVGKELTIGLGLVNCLNMSQFKGVIAHEFGHFSQRSMRIGSYIASANTIIHDMIFTRDKWDELLEKWKTADFRLSIAAWVITPIIGLIRQVLRLFYSFLNIMHASLTREMEFNADKVAVSVAGSEAIISALWRLDNRLEFWSGTLTNAYLAAQKGMHCSNLYEQQSMAQILEEAKRPTHHADLPADERGGRRYFTSSENSRVSMYASHPPNDQREANAKQPFVPCDTDERSPWILFSNPEELQHRMTRLVYEVYLQRTPADFVEGTEFRRFVEAESEGKELAEAYERTFDDRFIHLPDRQEMDASKVNAMEIADGLRHLKEEIKRLMAPVREIEEQMRKAREMAAGTSREKTLTFNNVTYTKKELQQAWTAMEEKREKLFFEEFTEWDIAFFALHRRLAVAVGRVDELERLYAQYAAISGVQRLVLGGRNYLMQGVGKLQELHQVHQEDLTNFEHQVRDVVRQLNEKIASLSGIDFVPLPNIDTVEELKEAIIGEGAFRVETGPIFEEGRFDKLMFDLGRGAQHCRRLDEKGIATILTLHAELLESYGNGSDARTQDREAEEAKEAAPRERSGTQEIRQ